VIREISEESGWQVAAGPLLDCWQHHISYEHKWAGLFAPEAIPALVMPDGYERSITAWLTHPVRTTSPTSSQSAEPRGPRSW
jgi:hypothetical protein